MTHVAKGTYVRATGEVGLPDDIWTSGSPDEKLTLVTSLQDFTDHDLRHTFVIWMVQNGVNRRTVADATRHKTIETTMKYAHLASEHIRGPSTQTASGKITAWSLLPPKRSPNI